MDATGAGLVVPVDNLTAGGPPPSTDALVFVAKTRAGLPSILMGDVTKVDVPVTGEESPWLPCNLGRADTNFVPPTNRTCVVLGTVVSTGNPTGGVGTATGGLRAGTLGILGRGEMGNAATLGVAEMGLGPVGGAAAGMMKLPVLGACGGAWPEMMSTWLPGPKPCGGTTNRALLRRICVPAARWVLVFMTILC